MFIRYLFAGKTMAQAYEAYFDFNASSVERYVHPNHPTTGNVAGQELLKQHVAIQQCIHR